MREIPMMFESEHAANLRPVPTTRVAANTLVSCEAGGAPTNPLPLVLAGPIVRRVEPSGIWLWFALSEPLSATGRVYHVPDNLTSSTGWTQVPTRTNVRRYKLGEHLFVMLVHLTPARHSGFALETVYGYDLVFQAPRGFEFCGGSGLIQRESITLQNSQKPTFMIGLAVDRRRLNVIHGSCASLGGGGYSAFRSAEFLMGMNNSESSLTNPALRPSALFLTGDQIYAEGWYSLPAIKLLAPVLLGWVDFFPEPQHLTDAEGHGDWIVYHHSQLTHSQVPPARSRLLQTTGPGRNDTTLNSHLVGFAEYAAQYLLTWSNVFWQGEQHELSLVRSVAQALRQSDAGAAVDDNHFFQDGLGSATGARKLMANIACYMMFDDHDVADNWPLPEAYNRTRRQANGRWIVSNAMCAVWFFQLLGNDPANAETIRRSFVFDAARLEYELVCKNATDYQSDALAVLRNQEVIRRLQSGVVRDMATRYADTGFFMHDFSFVAPTYPKTVFLDTHSQRNFMHETPLGVPSDHRPNVFDQMIRLNGIARVGELIAAFERHTPLQPLLVVSPTPIFWSVGEDGVGPTSALGTIIRGADADFWFDVRGNLEPLFSTLYQNYFHHNHGNGLCVIFSGDYHWGYVTRARRQRDEDRVPRVCVQLTSSAIKNQMSRTQAPFVGGGQRFNYPTLTHSYYRAHQTEIVAENHIALAKIEWLPNADFRVVQRLVSATTSTPSSVTLELQED